MEHRTPSDECLWLTERLVRLERLAADEHVPATVRAATRDRIAALNLRLAGAVRREVEAGRDPYLAARGRLDELKRRSGVTDREIAIDPKLRAVFDTIERATMKLASAQGKRAQDLATARERAALRDEARRATRATAARERRAREAAAWTRAWDRERLADERAFERGEWGGLGSLGRL